MHYWRKYSAEDIEMVTNDLNIWLGDPVDRIAALDEEHKKAEDCNPQLSGLTRLQNENIIRIKSRDRDSSCVPYKVIDPKKYDQRRRSFPLPSRFFVWVDANTLIDTIAPDDWDYSREEHYR